MELTNLKNKHILYYLLIQICKNELNKKSINK